MNIYEKISKTSEKIGIVKKGLSVSTGKSSYKAVSDLDVLNAVNQAERENGLVSYVKDFEVISQNTENVTTYDGKTSLRYFIRIKVCVEVVNIEKPEERVFFYGLGDGIDNGDKAVGKALTYGRKYALLSGYKIETGDDPDKYASVDVVRVDAKKNPMATQAQRDIIASSVEPERLIKICEHYGVMSLKDLTEEQAAEAIKFLSKGKNK